MGVSIQPEDPRAKIRRNVQRMAAQGASEQEIEAYLQHATGQEPRPPQRESLRLDIDTPAESTRALPYDKDRPGDLQALKGTVSGVGEVLKEPGTLATLSNVGSVGGLLEPVQVAASAAANRIPYREAYARHQESQETLPQSARTVAKMAGALPAAALLPFTPAVSGAAIGGATGALDANPDLSVGERVGRGAVGAAAGAVVGKGLEVAGTAARAFMTPKLDANIAARQASMKAADVANYGRAAAEGSRTGASSVVQNVLARPDIAPFAQMVRGSRQFANASDATILRETFKLMSKQQTGLARQLKQQGFDAAKQLQHDNIALAKQELLAAADDIMPSFRGAVQEHAKAMGEQEAVMLGKQAATRAISKSSGAKPATQSAQAITNRLKGMSPEERRAAIQGMLGRLRETIGVQPNAVSMGGALTTAIRPARVAPYLRQLGAMENQDQIARLALLLGMEAIP